MICERACWDSFHTGTQVLFCFCGFDIGIRPFAQLIIASLSILQVNTLCSDLDSSEGATTD